MMVFWQRHSNWALLAITVFLLVYRATHFSANVISWDTFGYYLYLPATFIHGDPTLEDASWVYKVFDQYGLDGTVYTLTKSPDGEPMYFFLMGMAILYLPFFLIGHLFALMFGFPTDGFSEPYQYAMAIGPILYTLIGFLFTRKILQKFTSEAITALVLLLLFFGTNAIDHLNVKSLETVNFLFMLSALIVWNTIRFHEDLKGKYLLYVAVFMALMILVKPSECVIILVPLIWGLRGFKDIPRHLNMLWNARKWILISVGAAMLIFLPQLLYWQYKTGFFLFDSYVNPGIGLDLFEPHLGEVLFGFRKGWFVYTPLMQLAMIGLGVLFFRRREVAIPIIAYVAIELWIVSSWSEWWYGAAYSCRPMIVTYPLLAIGLAILIREAIKWKGWQKIVLGGLIISSVFLNVFKWWQMYEGILFPYRMTKEYYFASFFQTEWSSKNHHLLLVERPFSGAPEFRYPELYQSNILHEESDALQLTDEYYGILSMPFHEITQTDHAWLVFDIEVDVPDFQSGDELLLVAAAKRQEGNYGYTTFPLEIEPGLGMQSFEFRFLTPEMRSSNDRIQAYLWNRSLNTIKVSSIHVSALDRK